VGARVVERAAEWEVWHQDTFDPECPRQVEVTGRGLVQGLVELWARHLFEAVQVDGRQGFSHFNLWWKQERKSIEIVGDWEGQVRLRRWVYGDRPWVGREEGDRSLLNSIAIAHQQELLRGAASEAILALASASKDREEFEEQLAALYPAPET
jgi:hypothetical protein